MEGIDREQMARLAGIEYEFNKNYTPACIGKKNLVTIPKNVWGDQFRNLNFTNIKELRACAPENVTVKQAWYQAEDGSFKPMTDKFGIIGDRSKETYAVHSGKYVPIQHSAIVEGMAQACDDTALNIFGHYDEDKMGRFNGYATYANPDFHFNLGVDNGFEDPVMLGIRFYNSHLGDSKFGFTVFGIRAVCQNYMAWGEIMGEYSGKHFAGISSLVQEINKVIRSSIDKVEVLKDRVHYIREVPVVGEDAEDLLWGIGLNHRYVDSIIAHQKELNPESAGSVFDLYNASTAFVTYRVGGSHMVAKNLDISDSIQKLLTGNLNKLVDEGHKAKVKFNEELPAKLARRAERRAVLAQVHARQVA